jgi:hypothetical protein
MKKSVQGPSREEISGGIGGGNCQMGLGKFIKAFFLGAVIGGAGGSTTDLLLSTAVLNASCNLKEDRKLRAWQNDWSERWRRLEAREAELEQTSTRTSHPRAWAKFERQIKKLQDESFRLREAMIAAGWTVDPRG